MSIRNLKPHAIWQYFENISAIPRGSKKEAKIIQFVRTFGESLDLETSVDQEGNVLIKKPATPGLESRMPVILQSHLDMVHQKNSQTPFDFDTEGIKIRVDGEWIKAEGTTLGADNGIGVASIMAVLAATDIAHPAIEALFTIDEETGMTGAKGLAPERLKGKILLNLDSEMDDELTIGCAGGINTSVKWIYEEEEFIDLTCYKLIIKGLRGGHSGMDIHLGRGNANKILTRFLFLGLHKANLRIIRLEGGGLRNAIPREANAIVAIPNQNKTVWEKQYETLKLEITNEFAHIEPGLKIELLHESTPGNVTATKISSEMIIYSLCTMPNGVFRMTPGIPDLVETSSNLAQIKAKDGTFEVLSMQRSSSTSGLHDIAHAIYASFAMVPGIQILQDGEYPGWEPKLKSRILAIIKNVYIRLFDQEPKILACHAGLECGIIGEKYPDLDMISIGPTIKHPHSPDEKVLIASVQKFWTLLQHILEKIPEN